MKPLSTLATLAFAAAAAIPAHAAGPSPSAGKQAVECFVMYKMAADVPANAGHRDMFTKLQNLMTWSMGKNQVTDAQATKWADEFTLASKSKTAVTKASDAKVEACNAFAKSQYDAFVKEKAASPAK